MRANYGWWTLVAFFCQASFALAADAVRWAPSLEAACQTAARSNRLVLVHFYTDSCPPCRAVDRNVFSVTAVADTIDKAYVPVKINAEHQPAVAHQLQVDRWPTDVMMTPAGYPVHRTISPQTPEAYVAELRTGVSLAIKLYKAEAVAQRNAAPPAAAPPAATPPFAPVAYEGPPNPNAPPAGQFSPPAPNDPRFNPGLPRNYQDSQPSYAVSPPPAAPAVNQPNYAPPAFGPAPTFPGAANAAPPRDPRLAQNPAPNPGVFPGANPPNPPVVDPRVAAASASMPAAPEMSVPAGNPPLAMEGFCPVTVLKTEKWIRGNTKWGAIHRDRTYLFKSEADQKEFLANPDLYSPMLSGYDVVKLRDQHIWVPGKRQLGIFYGKQMYFFADEDALKQFWSAPERFAPVARQAMAQGAGNMIRQ